MSAYTGGAAVAHQPFIEIEGFGDWFGSNSPQIYYCYFNAQQYHDAMFRTYGVTFPPAFDQAVVKRKAEFLAGRYCAQRSLTQLGVRQTEVGIGLHRSPAWPTSVIGSISHSNGLAMAVASATPDGLGMGIDVETVVSQQTLDNLYSAVACPDDMALLARESNQEAALVLFTLIFSVKESFFKAAYPLVGKYFDFDAVSVTELDPTTGRLWLHVNYDLHEKLPAGTVVQAHYHQLAGTQVVTYLELTESNLLPKHAVLSHPVAQRRPSFL